MSIDRSSRTIEVSGREVIVRLSLRSPNGGALSESLWWQAPECFEPEVIGEFDTALSRAVAEMTADFITALKAQFDIDPHRSARARQETHDD